MAKDYHRVKITENAKKNISRIGKKYGKKTYEIIRDLIGGLAVNPDEKGEPLRGRLKELYSLHYSRFRIIYQIDKGELIVLVVACGYHRSDSREDVYKAFERALDAGTIIIQSKPDQTDELDR